MKEPEAIGHCNMVTLVTGSWSKNLTNDIFRMTRSGVCIASIFLTTGSTFSASSNVTFQNEDGDAHTLLEGMAELDAMNLGINGAVCSEEDIKWKKRTCCSTREVLTNYYC